MGTMFERIRLVIWQVWERKILACQGVMIYNRNTPSPCWVYELQVIFILQYLDETD